MSICKSAHLGEGFDVATVRKLGLTVVHPAAPYHEGIPRGEHMPATGIPTLWQASVAGFPGYTYSTENIRNVLRQPNFNRWII